MAKGIKVENFIIYFMGGGNLFNLKKDYIAVNTKRRSGKKINRIVFLVAHDTGNKNSTAEQNVRYYKRSANDMSASAHIFVDDKDIIECIPLSEKAWHVRYNTPIDNQMFGCNANDCAIGIELCYFDDKNRSLKAYKNYVYVLASLCKKYNLNPSKYIVGHETLDPRRKTDPTNGLRYCGKTYVNLINDVIKEIKGDGDKLKLEHDWEWKMLEDNINELLNKKVLNGNQWLDKIKNRTITQSELSWLNNVLIARLYK